MNEETLLEALAAIEVTRLPGYAGGLAHDQETWAERSECGTTMCLAGWVTHLAGWEPVFVRSRVRDLDIAGECWRPGEDEGSRTISHLATELLGLAEDAGRLFYDCETLDDLYETGAELMGVAEQVLRDKVQDQVSVRGGEV